MDTFGGSLNYTSKYDSAACCRKNMRFTLLGDGLGNSWCVGWTGEYHVFLENLVVIVVTVNLYVVNVVTVNLSTGGTYAVGRAATATDVLWPCHVELV